MANNIRIDLSLTGEQATARGLDNVGDKAEGAGDDLQRMARDAGFLDKRLVELRGTTKQLAAEFAKTGDKDIFKQFQGSKRELGQLENVKKLLIGAGSDAGAKFGEELTASLRALKGPGIAALVGLAAAATPFLGGVISSAIVGGVGVGGIIGGIALAAKDARVQDAGMELGKHAMEAFSKAAEPFIKPVIDAIGVLDPVIDNVAGSLRDAFQGVAPALVPLTKGLAGLIQEMMPGLVLAFNDARPLLLVIGNELPKIGRALGTFFNDISEDPRGAIAAFQDLSRIIQVTLLITGRFLAGVSKLWATLSPIILASQGHFIEAAVAIGESAKAMGDANRLGGQLGDKLGDIANSATEAKNKMMALNATFLDFLDIARSAEKTNINYERTWDDMIETLSESARTLDITTEAGRKNREAIEAHADAIAERHRQRMEEGMTLQQSLPIMDAEIERLRKQLIQLGYNKKEANELINIYANWPTRAVTVIEAQGLEATKESLAELVSMFRLINTMTLGGIAGAKVGGKRARGGPVLAGQTYLVGENGPELLNMGSTNGHVTNATQTAAMMSGASGGTSVSINVSPQYTGMPLMDVLMAELAARLLITGGVIGRFRIPRTA